MEEAGGGRKFIFPTGCLQACDGRKGAARRPPGQTAMGWKMGVDHLKREGSDRNMTNKPILTNKPKSAMVEVCKERSCHVRHNDRRECP